MPVIEAPGAVGKSVEKHKGSYDATRQFIGVLLLYFIVQIILRVWISPSVDLDESEQLVLTQKLSWGYGSQPPLYTWIQFAFFKIFGLSVFALSLLKNILLFCTYLLTYLNARIITRRHACAVAAAASLLFIPQVAWESQRDLTHSVLASTLISATLFCFLRLRIILCLRTYVLFGLCVGLTVLSKYNSAVTLLALGLAAISLPGFRAIILDKRMAVAGIIASLVILPNFLWALHHPELALQSVGKLGIHEPGSWLVGVISGFKRLLTSSITFLGPLAIIYGILSWKSPAIAPSKKSEYTTFLIRMLLISYGLILLTILIFRVTEIHDRWLQPILIYSPIFGITLLQHRLDSIRLKSILAIAAVVAIAVPVALYGRIIWAERLHRTQPWNRPYDALTEQLKPSLEPAAAVVTDTTLMAGNLRLNIPNKIFTPPELTSMFVQTNNGFTLVWEAGDDAPSKSSARNGPRYWPPPKNLVQFAEKAGLNLNPYRAQYFTAKFKYHQTRQMKVGVLAPTK